MIIAKLLLCNCCDDAKGSVLHKLSFLNGLIGIILVLNAIYITI